MEIVEELGNLVPRNNLTFQKVFVILKHSQKLVVKHFFPPKLAKNLEQIMLFSRNFFKNKAPRHTLNYFLVWSKKISEDKLENEEQ